MRVKVKSTNEVLDIQFQQYVLGLYVCIYNTVPICTMKEQFCLDTTKEKFVEELKNNDNIEILEEEVGCDKV